MEISRIMSRNSKYSSDSNSVIRREYGQTLGRVRVRTVVNY